MFYEINSPKIIDDNQGSKYHQKNTVELAENILKRKIIIDTMFIGSLILASNILGLAILMYVLLIYISYRILTSSIQFSFAYLLMLIPNIGITLIPEMSIPLLNLLIPLAILKIFLSRISLRVNKAFLVITILFIIYEWVHALSYNIYNFITLISWTLTIAYVFLIVTCKKIKYNHEINIKYFISGVLVSSAYGLYTIFLTTGSIVNFTRSTVTDRFVGGAGDPNYYSMYILISVFCLLLLANKKRNGTTNTLKYYLLITILPVVGFMSLSRMYIIVFLFTSLLYIVRVSVSLKKYKQHKKFLLFIMFALSIVYVAFPTKIMDNINLTISRFTMYQGDLASLTSNRNIIIEDALNFLSSNPLNLLLGVGIQDYGSRIGAGMGYAHNIILELLLAWGVIGTIIFLMYMIFMYIEIKNRNVNKSSSLLGWLPIICMAISYMSINAIEVESFYLLLVLGIRNTFYS